MTAKEKQEYLQAFDRMRKRMEAKYVPSIARIIRNQVEDFISALRREPSVIAVNAVQGTEMYMLMRDLYVDAGTSWAAVVNRNIQRQLKNRRPIGFNEVMRALILSYFDTALFNDVQGITETTRRNLLDIFNQAVTDGLGFDDMVKLFQEYSLNMSKVRARLIARTETVTAANTGAQLHAEQSELELVKTWIATNDARTRQDHFAMDNQQVALRSPFLVAGAIPMQHPGDRGSDGSRTPANQVCNCRCTCAYEVARDERGVIIRRPEFRR